MSSEEKIEDLEWRISKLHKEACKHSSNIAMLTSYEYYNSANREINRYFAVMKALVKFNNLKYSLNATI